MALWSPQLSRTEQVKGKVGPFSTYWRVYGGLRALLRSAYFYAAAVITVFCWPYWSDVDLINGRKSAQLATGVLPGLMAFSLGGMAILLAFSGDRFLEAIRQNGRPDSLFMKVVAGFFHFLLVQSLGLVAAFMVMAHPKSDALAGIAFFFLAYAVMVAVAASAMLLNIARIFNAAQDRPKED